MGAIFLSYASEDRDRLDMLIPLLERAGSVWWDRRIRPGSRWDSTIEGAMNEAECMVVVWTRASLESQWVREEAREGLARGSLVPVLLDDIRPPLGFREIEAAVLHDWDGSADHPEAQLLLQSVISILEKKQAAGSPTPPVASTPAPRVPAARPQPAPVPERTTWTRTAPAVAGALVLGLIVWIAVGGNSDGSDSAAQASAVEEIPAETFLDMLISNYTSQAAAGGGLTQGYVTAACDRQDLTHAGVNSTRAGHLLFVNQSGYQLEFSRLNADGSEESPTSVPAGQSLDLESGVGDFWVARSGEWCLIYGAAEDSVEIFIND